MRGRNDAQQNPTIVQERVDSLVFCCLDALEGAEFQINLSEIGENPSHHQQEDHRRSGALEGFWCCRAETSLAIGPSGVGHCNLSR
jgi:hypothetical protein